MMMMGVIAFLCGVGFGVCVSAIAWLVTRPPRRELPPATVKQLARAARANRAQLRIVRGGGFVSPANADFDDGDTQ